MKYHITDERARHNLALEELEIFGPSKKRIAKEQKALDKLMLALQEQEKLWANRRRRRRRFK